MRFDRTVCGDAQKCIRTGIDDQTATRNGEDAVWVRVDGTASRVLLEFVERNIGDDFLLAAGRHVSMIFETRAGVIT